eukprot:6181184-Pleurochrysis_carterae.AAC.2
MWFGGGQDAFGSEGHGKCGRRAWDGFRVRDGDGRGKLGEVREEGRGDTGRELQSTEDRSAGGNRDAECRVPHLRRLALGSKQTKVCSAIHTKRGRELGLIDGNEEHEAELRVGSDSPKEAHGANDDLASDESLRDCLKLNPRR